MTHEHCMARKILKTIECIVDSDPTLKEFSVVPTADENLKNKSPVLYEENNLGLESWCIKHILDYVHQEVVDQRFRKLTRDELYKLNGLLIGTLLINPEVYTFWNIKRELVEKDIVEIDKEFAFTKLVLSHRSKTNEVFAYRRWLILRLKNKTTDLATFYEETFQREMDVTEFAAEKDENNYHAFNHRKWAFQNLIGNGMIEFGKRHVNSELQWSSFWISEHVSQHVGYHYRLFLLELVKVYCNCFNLFYEITYFRRVKHFLASTQNINYETILHEILGDWDRNQTINGIKTVFYVNYFTSLVFDLFFTVNSLLNHHPNHESMWYFRRHLIERIIAALYEVLGIKYRTNKTICVGSFQGNIVESLVNNEENGATQPKLFKYEKNRVETTLFYTSIVRFERDFLNKHSSDVFAKRHRKWLQLFLEMYDV